MLAASFSHMEPRFVPRSFWEARGGNGGFSLRKREFVETILARFPVNDIGNEDLYFCFKASEMYKELPRHVMPAPKEESTMFAVETIMHEMPFAVHKFWPWLDANTPGMTSLIKNCPEIAHILPMDLIQENKDWRHMICHSSAEMHSQQPLACQNVTVHKE